ncbi:MAG: GNAT family N-acetyltransferase [Mesorhizobium sp.]
MGNDTADRAPVAIVPMTLEHADSFHRAVDIVAGERKYLARLEAPPLQQTYEFLKDGIARNEPQLVAVIEGEVVGWCDIIRNDRPVHSHCGTLGMGIIPAYRGHGLGRRLIDAALAQAREKGFVRIMLEVRADNARAISLYRRVGFVAEGVERDAFLVDGEYHDLIMMALVERQNAIGLNDTPGSA